MIFIAYIVKVNKESNFEDDFHISSLYTWFPGHIIKYIDR